MKTQINSLKISLVLVVLFLSNILNAQQTFTFTLNMPNTDTVFAPSNYNIDAEINIIQNSTQYNKVFLDKISISNTESAIQSNFMFVNTGASPSNILLFNNSIELQQGVHNTKTPKIILKVHDINFIRIKYLVNNTTNTYKFLVIKFVTSIPTSIKSHQSQTLGLKVFPNPSTDKVNITINTVNEMPVQLFLYSITGQLVFEEKFTPSNLDPHELNVDNIARGTYILQVKEGDNIQTSKLILTNTNN